MRKILRIIMVSAGILSTLSAVILGCIYFEDVFELIMKAKTRFTNIIIQNGGNGKDYECE